MDCTVHGILQARILQWVALPFSGDLPNPGIEPRSPTLQADYLPAEPQEKPRNSWVGRLSLLQQIFPAQELNWGLLHCRQILYPLSYQGSPKQPYKGSQDNPIKQIQLMLQFCKRTNSASEMKVLPRQQMIELGVSLRFDSKTCVPDPLNYDFLIIKIQLHYIMPPSSFLPHQSSLCWFWLSWM